MQKMLDNLSQSRDEIRRQNTELERLATQDPLTMCLNRRSFFQQFETHWNRSQRYGHPLSCVLMDLDYFKSINDLHGHSVGDLVLQKVAAALNQEVRDTDLSYSKLWRIVNESWCDKPAKDARAGGPQLVRGKAKRTKPGRSL